MKNLNKYSEAVKAYQMLRRLLRPKLAQLKKMTKIDAYNAVTDEVNQVLAKYELYDETYWIMWLATGNLEIPTIKPLLVPGGYEIDGWSKPQMFRNASEWPTTGRY